MKNVAAQQGKLRIRLILRKSNPAIIVCEERERLVVAYRDAMQAKLEFESRIDSEILAATVT